jgi:hypothetical protein
MQSLTLKRRASGLRSVHDDNGEALGVLDLQHLELDDPEFEDVVRRHIAKKRTQAEAEQLINRLRAMTADPGAAADDDKPNSAELVAKTKARAKENGGTFSHALSEIARENPGLTEAARQETLLGAPSGLSKAAFNNRPRSLEIHEKILARAREKGISYGNARQEIEAEFPDLASAARQEGGLQVKDVKPLENGMEMVICSTEFGRIRNPNSWLAFIAENRAKRKNISFRAALSEVARSYPRLADAADRQVKRMGEFA